MQDSGYPGEPGFVDWLEEIEALMGNARAALRYYREDGPDPAFAELLDPFDGTLQLLEELAARGG